MDGPGKYDDACTAAREATGARGVVLIVLDGTRGSGFSCQLRGGPPDVLALAKVLRFMADEMEKGNAQ